MKISIVPRICLALLAAILIGGLWAASPAQAEGPCTGAPGERIITILPGGNGVAPYPLCVVDPPGNGTRPSAPAAANSYAAIAWHPDASDVWMDGNYLSPGGAENGALEACNRAMGGGCASAGEWSNSTMAVIRSRNGAFFTGWMGERGRDRQRALDECSAQQVLPCEVFKTFNSRQDHYFPGPEARVAYAVAAWVDGTDGYNRKLYIASGYASADEATKLAIDACQAANRSRTCKIVAQSAGGFIQTGTSDGNRDFSTVEMTASRARSAAQALCRRNDGVNCQVQSVYDSRRRGQFVHDYTTGGVD